MSADDAQPAPNPSEDALLACLECARAVGLGWWGSVARHPGPADAPVCVLCGEGAASLTAAQWLAQAAALAAHHTARGQRRSWREDAERGRGAARLGLQP